MKPLNQIKGSGLLFYRKTGNEELVFKLPVHSSVLLRGLGDRRMSGAVVLFKPISIMSNGQCVEVIFSGMGYFSLKTSEFILNFRFSFLFSSAHVA